MARGKARYCNGNTATGGEVLCVCVCVCCRVIVTRLVSAAGTGYFYTIRKPRIRDKMTLMKYDPVGEWS